MRSLGLACLTLPLIAQGNVAVARARIATEIARLDELFGRGDAQAYLGRFLPLWAEQHELFATRLRAVAGCTSRLERKSELLAVDPRADAWIAHVRFDHRAGGDAQLPVVSEQALLVFTDDTFRPRAQLEVSSCGLARVSAAGLECPACNYRIGGDVRWLIVPAGPERALCADAATFFALDGDVVLEFGVKVAERQEAAAAAVAELVARRRPQAKTTVEAWSGPWAGAAPAKLAADGARCVLQLAGRTTTLHVVATGRMQYLLALDGRTADLERLRAATQALLDSFALLDRDCDPEQVAAAAMRAHGADVEMVDGELVCATLGVAFRSPPNWKFAQKLAGGALTCELACPRGRGTLRITAWRPPNGAASWCEALANPLLAPRAVGPGARDTGWRQETGAIKSRELELPAHAEQREQRLRALLCDDLLVIAEGRCVAEAEAALRAALASLRRL